MQICVDCCHYLLMCLFALTYSTINPPGNLVFTASASAVCEKPNWYYRLNDMQLLFKVLEIYNLLSQSVSILGQLATRKIPGNYQ